MALSRGGSRRSVRGNSAMSWACTLYVTRIFRSKLCTFSHFDLEDSDDLAALLAKRYGL